ncbi:MAG: hypothetical protein ACYC27_07170 [Armatimonadota bacterium]
MSYKDKKLPIETLMAYLTNDKRYALQHLLDHMKSIRISPHWYATNAFNVKYKGAIIFRFSISEDGNWGINFTVAKVCDLDETLNALSSDMSDFFFVNLRRCNHCNSKHGNGKQIVILGNDYHICAEPEIQMRNPSMEDIEYMKRFVAVRIDNISKYK